MKQLLREFEKQLIGDRADEIREKLKADQERVNAQLESEKKRAKAFEPVTRQEISEMADVLQ